MVQRLRMEALEDRTVLSTVTVTTTLDRTDALDGVTSLREAIEITNAFSDLDTIAFAIPTLGSIGTNVIALESELPAITAPVFLDGYSQEGAIMNSDAVGVNAKLTIALDGSNAGAGANGLTVRGHLGSLILGLNIRNFAGAAIAVEADYTTIIGNFIGTDETGTTTAPNGTGVIVTSQGNFIGGVGIDQRNLISGNLGDGVKLRGAGAMQNQVLNNLIGTTATGSAILSNSGNGIVIGAGATNNDIGGLAVGSGNLISGNVGNGVVIQANSNRISGNRIGVDVTATGVLGNGQAGVVLAGNSNIVQGSFETGKVQVIGGNGTDGIQISGTRNVIHANGIGSTGANRVGNARYGVLVTGPNNFIGETNQPGSVNVISANGSDGVRLMGTSATENSIDNNRIGSDLTGEIALGNGGDGISLRDGTSSNQIGTLSLNSGNLVSGNVGNGIFLASDGNKVDGNFIGTNRVGTKAVANQGDGIHITGNGNRISGLFINGFRSTISGNSGDGIELIGNGNTVVGINIGSLTDASSGVMLPNGGFGVRITGSGNNIGGTEAVAANKIGQNTLGAVNVESGASNQVIGNLVVGSPNLGTVSKTPFSANSRLITSGLGNQASIYSFDSGTTKAALISTATIFPDFPNGVVRGVTADVDGDGIDDAIYVSGPGAGDRVRIISGATGKDLLTNPIFQAYPGEDFTDIGLFAAAADLNGDGRAELVVSPDDGGGARIQVFQFVNGSLTQIGNFFGIDDKNFRGGARIALGDITGDGISELIVGGGISGGPRIAIYDGTSLTQSVPVKVIPDFFAFEQSLRNGVYVAAGDINGDGLAEVVFGGGPDGGPRVLILNGATILTPSTRNPGQPAALDAPFANFFGFAPDQRGGIRVALKNIDGDNLADLVVGSGSHVSAQVQTYRGSELRVQSPNGAPVNEAFTPFMDTLGINGVYVG